jgi:hypothetical protein
MNAVVFLRLEVILPIVLENFPFLLLENKNRNCMMHIILYYYTAYPLSSSSLLPTNA